MKKIIPGMLALVLSSVGAFQALAASPRTMIEMTNKKPVAALAKSWEKVKKGEYSFTIDTSIELMSGKALTASAVKESLEKKLSTSHGVKVTSTAPDKVTIVFTCSEKEFLTQLAQVKIRALSSDIADTSGSDGGIRARPPGIILAEGEIRGFILKVHKHHVVFRVIETNSAEFKVGDSIDMKFDKEIPIKKNLNLYFVPEKGADGFWSPKEGTLTR